MRKLSYEIAQEMRAREAAGESQRSLAREFRVSAPMAWKVIHRKVYTKPPPEPVYWFTRAQLAAAITETEVVLQEVPPLERRLTADEVADRIIGELHS